MNGNPVAGVARLHWPARARRAGVPWKVLKAGRSQKDRYGGSNRVPNAKWIIRRPVATRKLVCGVARQGLVCHSGAIPARSRVMDGRVQRRIAGASTLLFLANALRADITVPVPPPPQADAQAVRGLARRRDDVPLRSHHGGGAVTFWIVQRPDHGKLSDLRLLGDNRATINYQNDGAEAGRDRPLQLCRQDQWRPGLVAGRGTHFRGGASAENARPGKDRVRRNHGGRERDPAADHHE